MWHLREGGWDKCGKIYSQTLQWWRSHNIYHHWPEKTQEKWFETNLDQELEIDIIGLGCCSFGLFALTSGLEIDPLCVQFKWNLLETEEEEEEEEEDPSRNRTIRERKKNNHGCFGSRKSLPHSLLLHLQFIRYQGN